MTKVRVAGLSLSLDGYGAGPHQDLENAFGIGGDNLSNWMFGTRTFQRMIGKDGGSENADDAFFVRSLENVGAFVMGRNMFGPIRGEWGDDEWRGWWGENPPYHAPVYVLTHHPRASLEMDGGTVFHFVTDGTSSALEQAKAAAGGKDVRISGGVSTVRQYVEAGEIDEIHLAISPVLLGAGENFFAGLDLPALGFEVSEHVPGGLATHIVLIR